MCTGHHKNCSITNEMQHTDATQQHSSISCVTRVPQHLWHRQTHTHTKSSQQPPTQRKSITTTMSSHVYSVSLGNYLCCCFCFYCLFLSTKCLDYKKDNLFLPRTRQLAQSLNLCNQVTEVTLHSGLETLVLGQ